MRSKKKPDTLDWKYELDTFDEGQIRSIYSDLHRETGVYGGPGTAFKAIMIFLSFNQYEVKKRPQQDEGDSTS